MTLYTKDFILKFAKRKLNLPQAYVLEELKVFENEYGKEFPVDFPIETLINEVCELTGISSDEYYSTFRYGWIPLTRQLICYILTLYGATNRQICELTGFSPPRVHASIEAAHKYVIFNQDKINRITDKLGL